MQMILKPFAWLLERLQTFVAMINYRQSSEVKVVLRHCWEWSDVATLMSLHKLLVVLQILRNVNQERHLKDPKLGNLCCWRMVLFHGLCRILTMRSHRLGDILSWLCAT
uniref:Uncharacterized protein n=1 Tax=Opuntia streptacantha TaxID=393608 RepID=A0A7C9A225_OPUST